MLTSPDTQSQFRATIDLFRGQPDAVRRFDVSIEGFWTSFCIIFLAVVPYLVVILSELRWANESQSLPPDAASFLITRLILLPIEWVAFPLLMIPLARWLSLQQQYVAYVVVRNWTNLPAIMAYAFCGLFYLGGIVGEEGLVLLNLLAFGIALRLKWLALRLALGTDISVSIALMVIDILLGITLLFLVDGLIGGV